MKWNTEINHKNVYLFMNFVDIYRCSEHCILFNSPRNVYTKKWYRRCFKNMKHIMIKLIPKTIHSITITVCWWFFVLCMANSNRHFVWMKLTSPNFTMRSLSLDDKTSIVFKQTNNTCRKKISYNLRQSLQKRG